MPWPRSNFLRPLAGSRPELDQVTFEAGTSPMNRRSYRGIARLNLEGAALSFEFTATRPGCFYCDLIVEFDLPNAGIPPVRDVALSHSDLERLKGMLRAELDDIADDEGGEARPVPPNRVFVAYDSFFELHLHGDGSARFVVDYRPDAGLKVGAEAEVSDEELQSFLNQLEALGGTA